MPDWFIQAGPVMWPLLLCSVMAGAVILERIGFWLQEQRRTAAPVIHKTLHLVERGLFDEAALITRASSDAVARILHHGLTHHHFSLTHALAVAADTELKRMRRYLGVLDTIITVAPLLGIFGTVTGILVAFSTFEGRVPDPQVVAAGIAQAVVTTAFGLGIAIPTVIAYNIFAARVEQASSLMSTQVTNFQILYRKGQRRVRKHARTESALEAALESVER